MVGAEREGQASKEPYRIVRDDTSYDIIIPAKNKRIFVALSPDGESLITKLEPLTEPEGEKLEVETQFTRVVRHLIVQSIEHKAALASPGSEQIGLEIGVLDLDTQFGQLLPKLADFSYSTKRVKGIITSQGNLLSVGQEHIGFMSPLAREEVVRLSKRVDNYYNRRARQHTESQPRRSRSR